MIEAENGSVAMAVILRNGVRWYDPLRAWQPEYRERRLGSRVGSFRSWKRLYVGRSTQLALYNVNFVQRNAVYYNFRCNAAWLARPGCAFQRLTMAPSQRGMGRQDRSSLADPPLRRVAFAQFFGLAASIA